MFKSINPYNGETIAEFRTDGDKEISIKLEKAEIAFKNWSSKSLSTRVLALKLFSSKLQKRVDPYAKVISLEMGKTLHESVSEINKCILTIDYYAEHAEE